MIVIKLISAGFNINEKNYDGITPLMTSCIRGNYLIVDYLLNNNV